MASKQQAIQNPCSKIGAAKHKLLQQETRRMAGKKAAKRHTEAHNSRQHQKKGRKQQAELAQIRPHSSRLQTEAGVNADCTSKDSQLQANPAGEQQTRTATRRHKRADQPATKQKCSKQQSRRQQQNTSQQQQTKQPTQKANPKKQEAKQQAIMQISNRQQSRTVATSNREDGSRPSEDRASSKTRIPAKQDCTSNQEAEQGRNSSPEAEIIQRPDPAGKTGHQTKLQQEQQITAAHPLRANNKPAARQQTSNKATVLQQQQQATTNNLQTSPRQPRNKNQKQIYSNPETGTRHHNQLTPKQQ